MSQKIISLSLKCCNFVSSEDRIRNGAKKLVKARATTQQGRLDAFFTVSHTVSTTTPTKKLVCVYVKNFTLKNSNVSFSFRRHKLLIPKDSNEKMIVHSKGKSAVVLVKNTNKNSFVIRF